MNSFYRIRQKLNEQIAKEIENTLCSNDDCMSVISIWAGFISKHLKEGFKGTSILPRIFFVIFDICSIII